MQSPAEAGLARENRVEVRACTPADRAAAHRVADEAFAALRRIYRPSSQAIDAKNRQAQHLYRLVACEQDQVIGTVQYLCDKGLLRAMALAVAPAWQRHGVARALLDRLVELAAQQGCRAVSLYTIEKTGNVPIFERLGFTVVERQPAPDLVALDGTVLDEVRMERPVAD